jgi:hypothetical protein
MNQHQLQVIEYLREENRVLREQLGERRLRFNDDQRRRLAAKAKGLGRKLLAEVATIVTPETLLAWHHKLIAQKYDGSRQRGPGRPHTRQDIEALVVRLAEENREGATAGSKARSLTWDTSWRAAPLPPSSPGMVSNPRRSGAGRPPGRSFSRDTGN